MKKSLFFIAALTFGLFACAQNPPKNVADNFNQKFKNASKVKWGQEEKTEWEAEFKMDGKEMSASFDNAGKWLSTETKISKKALPENAMKAVTAAYNGWDIEEVESIEKPDLKGYELEIEKGKKELEIVVTSDGKITVNKESEDEK